MDVIKAIEGRFSCRKFTDQPVSEEDIRTVLRAGTFAPSGKNAQGWHFTVVRSDEAKEKLRLAAGATPPPGFGTAPISPPGYNAIAPTWPFQGDFCGAPVIILISGQTDVPWPDVGPRLAAQNIMLAATARGLATLWSTVFTKDLFRDAESAALRQYLLPPDHQLYATLFLGHPAQVPAQRPPRKEAVVTWL